MLRWYPSWYSYHYNTNISSYPLRKNNIIPKKDVKSCFRGFYVSSAVFFGINDRGGGACAQGAHPLYLPLGLPRMLEICVLSLKYRWIKSIDASRVVIGKMALNLALGLEQLSFCSYLQQQIVSLFHSAHVSNLIWSLQKLAVWFGNILILQ